MIIRLRNPKEERNGKEKLSKWPKKEYKVGGNKGRVIDVKKFGRFLYNEPHRAKDCPMKGKINVILAAASEDKEEDTPTPATTLQILGPMKAGQLASRDVGLTFVLIVMNERKVSALLDTGTTHNFVSKRMFKELGLKTGMNS